MQRDDRDGDHDVGQDHHDVGPAVGGQAAEHPRVHLPKRVVVQLHEERLDRVGEGRDGDTGEDDDDFRAAATDGAAEGVRRADGEQSPGESAIGTPANPAAPPTTMARVAPRPAPLETPRR